MAKLGDRSPTQTSLSEFFSPGRTGARPGPHPRGNANARRRAAHLAQARPRQGTARQPRLVGPGAPRSSAESDAGPVPLAGCVTEVTRTAASVLGASRAPVGGAARLRE